MVFRQSQRFYLLFQHATSPAVAAGDGYLVEPADERTGRLAAYHFASQLGPSAAVVAPDSRSQRSKERIIPAASFKRMGAAVRRPVLPAVLCAYSMTLFRPWRCAPAALDADC